MALTIFRHVAPYCAPGGSVRFCGSHHLVRGMSDVRADPAGGAFPSASLPGRAQHQGLSKHVYGFDLDPRQFAQVDPLAVIYEVGDVHFDGRDGSPGGIQQANVQSTAAVSHLCNGARHAGGKGSSQRWVGVAVNWCFVKSKSLAVFGIGNSLNDGVFCGCMESCFATRAFRGYQVIEMGRSVGS